MQFGSDVRVAILCYRPWALWLLGYRVGGIEPGAEQGWKAYAISFLAFHALGIVVLYALLRLQPFLLFNSPEFPPASPDLAVNTAVSFVTNTSWQSYGGETTLTYLSQMAGITVQSFLSAASGMAVVIAFIRGFADDVRQRRLAISGSIRHALHFTCCCRVAASLRCS